ncbi:hypothetical protein GGI12_000980 [Dipsacomyces acuminosporus]|nr:hypothetical protein GGI12_000980 [Dipsacomyces acuminosporus]
MAALGNLKAVTAYIRGGVKIDGQNKMNGWSALHWACARGQAKVVDLLIRAGADLDVKNNKGQTPLDLCKSDEIRALFPGEKAAGGNSAAEAAEEESEIGFTPNYLANPDLTKLWGVPDDAMMSMQGDSGYIQQLQNEASIGGSNMRQRLADAQAVKEQPVAAGSAAPVRTASVPGGAGSGTGEREVLVYGEQVGEESLLGSVFVPNSDKQTVADLSAMIRDELDGIPDDFALARYNGKHTIPISSKQEQFGITKVFRGAEDAAVVVRKN